MDVSLVIRQRLEEFGLEQRDLARAAQVTESYISQLLTRRKSPPAPNRTDIYDKMDKFLRLPKGEMARLATAQRREGLKRELGEGSAALFGEVRELILRKCHPDTAPHVRAIFHQQPFGELERLVTGKLLYVVKGVAKQELQNEYWLRMVADLGGHSYQEMRVIVLEFLDQHDLAIRRGHDQPLLLRHLPIRIAKEIGEESSQKRERGGPAQPAGGHEAGGRNHGRGNERKTCAIDLHRREC